VHPFAVARGRVRCWKAVDSEKKNEKEKKRKEKQRKEKKQTNGEGAYLADPPRAALGSRSVLLVRRGTCSGAITLEYNSQ